MSTNTQHTYWTYGWIYELNNCGAFNPWTDCAGVELVSGTVIVYLILCSRD